MIDSEIIISVIGAGTIFKYADKQKFQFAQIKGMDKAVKALSAAFGAAICVFGIMLIFVGVLGLMDIIAVKNPSFAQSVPARLAGLISSMLGNIISVFMGLAFAIFGGIGTYGLYKQRGMAGELAIPAIFLVIGAFVVIKSLRQIIMVCRSFFRVENRVERVYEQDDDEIHNS